jgi:hypothetical protein
MERLEQMVEESRLENQSLRASLTVACVSMTPAPDEVVLTAEAQPQPGAGAHAEITADSSGGVVAVQQASTPRPQPRQDPDAQSAWDRVSATPPPPPPQQQQQQPASEARRTAAWDRVAVTPPPPQQQPSSHGGPGGEAEHAQRRHGSNGGGVGGGAAGEQQGEAQAALSPETDAAWFRVLQRSVVREGAEMDSPKKGEMEVVSGCFLLLLSAGSCALTWGCAY